MAKKAENITNNIKHDNIISVELSQIRLPDISERVMSNARYVRYGDDNNFNVFLEHLRDTAPLHNAILTSKLEQAYGEGLTSTAPSSNVGARLFFAKVNDLYDMNELYFRCLQDLILYGGFYIETIFSADGKIAQLWHIPFGKIRCGRKDLELFRIKEYLYCEDWLRCYQLGYTSIEPFDLENKVGRKLFAYRAYMSGREFYSLPDYISSLSYIAAEAEISNYTLAELRNSFNGSVAINFCNGLPSEEEQLRIKQRLTEQLGSTDNAGKIIVTFSPNQDTKPDIVPLQTTNAADKYNQVEQTVLQNVLSGHRVVSPLLVGIRTENNGLGSNADEIQNAFELWNNTVIKPYQNKVLNVLNMLVMLTAHYDGWKLEPTTIQPITFTFSEAVLTQILSKNELRQKIGYDAVEEVSAPTATINETNE